MKTGRPKQQLNLNDDERLQLESIAASRSNRDDLLSAPKIVFTVQLMESPTQPLPMNFTEQATVGIWRQRYLGHGIQGLHDDSNQADREQSQTKRLPC